MDLEAEKEFTEFVKRTHQGLRRRAYLLCGDWCEADDLTQLTLIKVLLKWSVLDRHDELMGYTRIVMTRTFISERRAARWAREALPGELPEPEPDARDQDRLEDHPRLFRALDRLGHRQRAVIVMRYWEGLSVSEAAEALGCSPSTVRSQTSRALAAMRSSLQPENNSQ